MKIRLETIVLISFGLSGMAALVYEVVWTRLLVLIFGSTTYAVSTMLCAFLSGLAVGSYVLAKKMHRIKNAVSVYAFLEIGIGVYGLLFIFMLKFLQYPLFLSYSWFQNSFFLFSMAQFFIIFLAMLIPTTMMGATFPIVSKICVKQFEMLSRDIGIIYSINTLGAVVGAFLAGFVLIPLFGITITLIIAAVVNLCIGLLLINCSKFRPWSLMLLVTLFLVPFVNPQPLYTNVSLFPHATSPESFKQLSQLLSHSPVTFYREGSHATVTVFEYPKGIFSLNIDGRSDASTAPTDMRTQLLLGYLPLIFLPNASRVLNIGLGAGFTLAAIEKFNEVKEIDIVEIETGVIEAHEKVFSKYTGTVLNDARVNLVVNDARNFLRFTDKKYDVIIAEPSHPLTSSSANLFTREFFQTMKDHATESTVVVQWVPLYHLSPKEFMLVLKTFASVFNYTEVWLPVQGDAIIIGTQHPHALNFENVDRVFQNERIVQDMRMLGISSPRELISLRVLGNEEVQKLISQETQINTDDHPLLEFRTARSLQSLKDTTQFIMEKSAAQQ